METEVKLTKLAQCAGCGAKVGAGTLAKLLDGIPTRSDERLLVGFDKSDDASVYKIDENTALVQTLDFFPPIVDDPEMFGEIAAVNAISDIYAMGADPKLALNIMCVTKDMPKESIQAILRGGYKKAYEVEFALQEIEKQSGRQFDYKLADIFVNLVRNGKITIPNED